MIEAMVIFLMKNIYIYKMFGTYFNFNTFEDFHNHYLKKDILLLVDSFEQLISKCLKCLMLGLDACHYFSAPGLSWDAMLKMKKSN